MIREVTIRRFKRFEEVTFDLRGNVVLAGTNNSGKTTVLQAISAWSLALEQWRLLHDENKRNGYTKKPVSRQTFNAVPLRSFDLLWKDRAYHGIIEIEVVSEFGWRLCMQMNADTTEQIYVRPRIDADPAVFEKAAALKAVYVSSASGLSIEEPVYQPAYVDTVLSRQKAGDVVRNLLWQVSTGANWDALVRSVKRLFEIELLVPETTGGQIFCEFRRPGEEFSLDLLSAGSGLQQVILLLACLYTRPSTVLLIDEPDAHLHVFLQDTIFGELREVAGKLRSQLIMATHSEVMFRSVPPEHLCMIMGKPRRLADVAEREKLAEAMRVLEQADMIQALSAPGVLYVEGWTDLYLLRAWARVLDHPVSAYLERRAYWKEVPWAARLEGAGIKAREHFDALKLVNPEMTGVWIVDGDGKQMAAAEPPAAGRLNRAVWNRYESESYLVHPTGLARFVSELTGANADAAVSEFFGGLFGAAVLVEGFVAAPFAPPPIVESFLRATKARTDIISAALEHCGLHGFEYTRYSEIAAQMLPEEIHPEVVDKLNFIQKAFGL